MRKTIISLSAALLLLGGAFPAAAGGARDPRKLEVTYYYLPG